MAIALGVFGFVVYSAIAGAALYFMVDESDDFFDNPFPFFAGVFWPVTLLLVPAAASYCAVKWAFERRKAKADERAELEQEVEKILDES